MKTDNINITPLVKFDKDVQASVPGLTEEQYKSLIEMNETEVSEETANYLIIRNYAQKAGE